MIVITFDTNDNYMVRHEHFKIGRYECFQSMIRIDHIDTNIKMSIANVMNRHISSKDGVNILDTDVSNTDVVK